MRRTATIIVHGLLLCCAMSSSGQQVVHIENKRLAAAEKGFSGNVSLQANFIQNVNDIFQTTNLLNLQYAWERHSILSLTNFNLNVLNNKRVVNDGYQHVRYNFRLSRAVTIEAYSQIQYNEILKMRYRMLQGAGPRFSIIEQDSVRTRLFAGLSSMVEYEEETTGRINRAMRLSTFLSVGFPFARIFLLDAIAYYQPDISYFEDFRASMEATIEAKVTARLTLELRQNLSYDSHPPDGIRHWMYNLSNGIRFRF